MWDMRCRYADGVCSENRQNQKLCWGHMKMSFHILLFSFTFLNHDFFQWLLYSILYMHFFFSRGKKRLYCSLFFNCIQSLNWIWNTPQSLILIYPLWCFARLLRWTVAQLLFYQANSDSNNRNKKQKCITNISLWKPIPES